MISIVVANFNKRQFIEATLRSALDQAAVSEIIVVDDASTDGSIDVIRGLAEAEPRIVVVSLDRNRGQSFSENRGLERATGDYVIYLDSDDLLAPGCCERRLAAAMSAPDADAWVFPMSTFTDDPARPTGSWVPRSGDHLRNVLAHKLDWQLMQALWRREFLVRIGGFDETFVRLTDVSLHTRALLAGARIRCFPSHGEDSMYRIAPDRYSWSVEELAARHVKGALHYVVTYRGQVPPHLRHLLSGTLLAAMQRLLHWWRIGKLPTPALDRLSAQLIEHGNSARERAVLKAYLQLCKISPIRPRGLTWVGRRALGVPT
jgi:glycosyltransferase involved in cell wall biosynthesis